MKALSHWSLSAGVLVALLAAAGYVCPTWSSQAGLNLREWFGVRVQLAEACRRAEILDQEARRNLQCQEAKNQVLDDLCAGRSRLLAAAARFRELGWPAYSQSAGYVRSFRAAYPGQTDEERSCRQVIRFVRLRGPEGEALADSFEAELAQHLTGGPLGFVSSAVPPEMH